MKDVISVDTVVALLHKCDHEPDEITKYVVIDQSEFVPQLHSLLISKLPEKVKLSTSVYQNYGDGNVSERIGYKHGYNDCLDDVKAVLAEMFGVQNEK